MGERGVLGAGEPAPPREACPPTPVLLARITSRHGGLSRRGIASGNANIEDLTEAHTGTNGSRPRQGGRCLRVYPCRIVAKRY